MIDYRKHRWVIAALLLGWLAWLFAMSRVGLAGLHLIGEDLWLRIIWIIVLGAGTFGLPVLLHRRFQRSQNRTR